MLDPDEIDYDENERDWLYLSGIRQTLSLASGKQVTYEAASSAAAMFAPELDYAEREVADVHSKSRRRLYEDRALARSELYGEDVSPESLIAEDIGRLEEEAGAGDAFPELTREILTLRGLLRVEEREVTETEMIMAEISPSRQIGSKMISLQPDLKGKGYTVYELPNNRWLRIQVFHPDPREWKSGVDVVFEEYADSSGEPCVRFAALQYKIWNGTTLYDPDGRTTKQLTRARSFFCDRLACQCDKSPKYRLPCCAVFLRPTDKKQSTAGMYASKALHTPVCIALAVLEKNKKISAEDISGKSVPTRSFQELFNRCMIGSRWMAVSELDQLYGRIGFDETDRVLIHAQKMIPEYL